MSNHAIVTLSVIIGCWSFIAWMERDAIRGRLRGHGDWFHAFFCTSCDALLPKAPFPGDACPTCGALCQHEPGWRSIPIRCERGARWHYRLGVKSRLERRVP